MTRTHTSLFISSLLALVACEAGVEPDRQANTGTVPVSSTAPAAQLDLTGASWTSQTAIMQNDIGEGIFFEMKSPAGYVLKTRAEPMNYRPGSSTFRFFGNGTATYTQLQKVQKPVDVERGMLLMQSFLEFVSEAQASFEWQLEDDRLFLTVQDVRASWGSEVGLGGQDRKVRPFADALRELNWDETSNADSTAQRLVSELNGVAVGTGFPRGTSLELQVVQWSSSEIRLAFVGDDGELGDSITLAR